MNNNVVNNDDCSVKNNLIKYREIMQKYRNGEYGFEPLTLYEILAKAKEENLLNQMSLEELDELIETSSGISRELFVTLRKELVKKMTINNK